MVEHRQHRLQRQLCDWQDRCRGRFAAQLVCHCRGSIRRRALPAARRIEHSFLQDEYQEEAPNREHPENQSLRSGDKTILSNRRQTAKQAEYERHGNSPAGRTAD